eukprot:NODE_9651_length_1408_cov_7.302888.p1 GENE.NODE_9651_length_1408_cov_7.302888~~NODE_9651_length_1408_cov_7.302888.p1  ORF type:complete len:417 (-),score=103.47 NODE_9651_length_1408_cov_7.302888:49-1299(-)
MAGAGGGAAPKRGTAADRKAAADAKANAVIHYGALLTDWLAHDHTVCSLRALADWAPVLATSDLATREGLARGHHPMLLGKAFLTAGWCQAERCVKGAVLFLPSAEGPFGQAHGGAVFTALDECCKLCVGGLVHGVTEATVIIRAAVTLDVTHMLRAEVAEEHGDRVLVRAKLEREGTVCGEMEATLKGDGIIMTVSESIPSEVVAGSKFDGRGILLPADALDGVAAAASQEARRKAWVAEELPPLLSEIFSAARPPLRPLPAYALMASRPTAGSGRLWFETFWHETENRLVAFVRLLGACQGLLPGMAHDGAVALAFDALIIAMLRCFLGSKITAYTLTLSLSQLTDVPLEETLLCSIVPLQVERSAKTGRLKCRFRGTLGAASGAACYAESDSLWLTAKPVETVPKEFAPTVKL